jgi:U3 small nucleolar RNA-associated protein 18
MTRLRGCARATLEEPMPKISSGFLHRNTEQLEYPETQAMPRQRSKKLSASHMTVQQPKSEVELEKGENESEIDGLHMMEKDSDEEELDRLVLGDGSEFKAQLGRAVDLDRAENSEGYDVEGGDLEEEEGLEDVDDADVRDLNTLSWLFEANYCKLFFLDAGPSIVDPSSLMPHPGSDGEERGDGAAWDDSDDDRLAISLAGNSRLRKLRVSEGEDIVNGRDYTRRLRRQFEILHPVPEWAQCSTRSKKRRRRSSAGSDSSMSSNDMDIDGSDLSTLPLARLLQDAGSLIRTSPATGKRTKLRPEVIDIQRTRDISLTQPSAISSLCFHPEYPVILSSGPASTLYLHHIAPTAHPTPNPLLTSVHIKHTPLATSSFLHPKGDKIFFSGRRRYFHTWDLPTGTIQKVTRIYGHKEEQRSMERFKLSPCGRYIGLVGSSKKGGGVVNVLDANTTQWIAAARIEGKNGVADFAWWGDGEGITIVGKGGEVGEWSVESKSFIARWIDDGSIGATVLALGGKNGPKPLGGDRWVVIGSQSGVVNIYDRRTFASGDEIKVIERPEPNRKFEQLTTPTSNLEISPDGQLLVLSSKWKKDALRLVHLPSCTVYRNWPTSSTPLGRITAVAFASGSDMLAVANEAGKIRLWDIRS